MQSNSYQYIYVDVEIILLLFPAVSLTSPKKQAMLAYNAFAPTLCGLTNDRVYTLAHSCVTTLLNKQHMTETG